MAVERSLILIKPDAVERRLAGEIVGRIERRGFTLRAGKLIRVNRELGETHYAEHREKPFFGELVEFITSGPTLGDVSGLDVVELGCGTAYFSAWFAKRGARPVGVDPTPAQLASARRMQAETGIEFPLVQAPAERVPLPDASFDLAISEYGA